MGTNLSIIFIGLMVIMLIKAISSLIVYLRRDGKRFPEGGYVVGGIGSRRGLYLSTDIYLPPDGELFVGRAKDESSDGNPLISPDDCFDGFER
jgi:hypothetical protein